MKRIPLVYGAAALILGIVSFGFIDPNFPAFTGYAGVLVSRLMYFVYRQSVYAAAVYTAILLGLFWAYSSLFQKKDTKNKKRVSKLWYGVIGLFLLAFPAFSYDIFNYMATAKVAFYYRENPYVVMPIEISNEPMLSYTRAANKVALYGPTWIALTSLPHLLSAGKPLFGVYAFKCLAALFYGVLIHLIYRKTKRYENAVFFALHPLVLIEVLVSGHNDVSMIALAYAGLMLWERTSWKYKAAGLLLFAASVLVKGATIVLVPIFFLSRQTWEQKMTAAFWLSLGIFFVAPLREELYPWYAVWWITPAAFLPIRPKSFIHGLAFWFGLGLMLRYVPWIATREYGGLTPGIRFVLMCVPVGIFVVRHLLKKHSSSFV